jgi:group I intron endonuclease
MYIYKIVNSINGKCYIGQSIKPIEKRFKRHIDDAMKNKLDTHFARAIRKYGPSCFHLELIEICTNQIELTQREIYWIKYFNSIEDGYNETDASNKCGGNTYMSKTSDELTDIGDKIRATKIGEKNPQAKKVKCLNVKKNIIIIFNSLAECRDYFHETNHQFISRRCLKKIRKLYKDSWLFSYINDDFDYAVIKDSNKHDKKTRRKIEVTNLSDNTTNIFKTYRDAERFYNIKPNTFRDNPHFKGETFLYENLQIKILN